MMAVVSHTGNLVFQGLVQHLMLKDNKKVIKHSVLEAGLVAVLKQKKKNKGKSYSVGANRQSCSQCGVESSCSKNKTFSYFCYVLT